MTATDRDLEAYLDVEERESKPMGRGTLRRLIGQMFRHPAPLAFGVLVMSLAIAATLVEPWLFGYAIDEAILPRNWGFLRELVVLYLVVVCGRVTAMIAQGYLFELLGQKVTQDLRCLLFSHLQRLPVSIFDKNPAGRLVTRVTNDVASIAEMFSAGFVAMLCNALLVLGILIGLMAMSLKLGLIAAAVFPLLLGLSVYFSRRLKVTYRDARSRLSALNAFLAENILGMKVLQLFNRQEIHLGRFDRLAQWYADAQISTTRVFAFFQPTITWCSGVSMALVIWFGGVRALHGDLKPGVLVAFFSYVLSLFQPIREIADKWNIFLSSMASAERLFAILEWPTEFPARRLREDSLPYEGIEGAIEFENVWFAYEGERWVLRDFRLRIPAGARVGVVGHTGAGKTTLISLLLRLYEPQKGRILIDGKDIREYDKRRLRASFGLVQQDVFLFSGSKRDNITFWKDDAPPEVARVLARMGYPGWLDAREGSVLQERGANLSMGERQVLAFTRALAGSPRIWILDEATANMDSRSEALLQTALGEASRGRTTILIAHRLSTVRDADLILVLHKGALVEQGRHEELVRSDGLYARIQRYQRAQESAGGV